MVLKSSDVNAAYMKTTQAVIVFRPPICSSLLRFKTTYAAATYYNMVYCHTFTRVTVWSGRVPLLVVLSGWRSLLILSLYGTVVRIMLIKDVTDVTEQAGWGLSGLQQTRHVTTSQEKISTINKTKTVCCLMITK